MRVFAGAIAALVALAPTPAKAGDDADLIPQDVLDAKPAPTPAPAAAPAQSANRPPSTLHSKVFAEDAFSAWSPPGSVPVPYPSGLVFDWQNRTSLDASLQWKARPWLTLTLSDRLNVFEQDGQKLVSADTVRNDLREVSATWEPTGGFYLEAGRINVRNGAALGFNPADFFKTRTLVGQASLDPSVIRQNRLGTLMVRAQALWAWGSASVAYAPKVAEPSPVTESKPVGVDPRFDATNAAHRVLCTLNLELLDLSPQLLGYFELHRSKLGANVTRSIGDAVVAYAEWAAGPEQDLIARAAAFGRQSATLPASAPPLPPTDTGTSLRNDAAAGFSWTVATAVTFNVEYHFHEAGFTRSDWKNWFDIGTAPGAPAPLTNELWFVRGYASDQQEPSSQHQMFVRASWPRAFTPDLELSAFAFISLLDGSVLSQLAANYYLSDRWTASAYLSGNFGDGRTERGSFPQRGNVIVQLTRYL
jgi:hypothetical protein